MQKPFPPLTKTLLAMLGPSVVFVALSINGGEMLLWPSLVANFGLAILWPVSIILVFQYFVNIEIERYTLVTGKHIASALTENKAWLALVFGVTALAAQVWPAWMTTAGNIIAVVAGVPAQQERTVGLVLAVALLLLSLLLFRRPDVYKALEKISRVGLTLSLLIILLVVVVKFDLALFWEGLKGLVNFGYLPQGLPRFDFVAALAYGGVAGILNLVQSEWIKDKGYGVNTELPISNSQFPNKTSSKKYELESVEAKRNFQQWFRAINKEHSLLFLGANVITIFLLAFLGRLLLPLGTAQGFGVLRAEILTLNDTFPHLGTLFGVGSMLLFIMANLVILDATGRLFARIISPVAKRYNLPKLANHQIISAVTALVGVAILLLSLVVPQFKQPFFLLVTSACLGAFTMWLYPPLVLRLNHTLPAAARPSLFRNVMVALCSLGYGVVTLWAASLFVPAWILVPISVLVIGFHISIYVQIARNTNSPKNSTSQTSTR